MAAIVWRRIKGPQGKPLPVAYLVWTDGGRRGRQFWRKLGPISKTQAHRMKVQFDADRAAQRIGVAPPEFAIPFREVAAEYVHYLHAAQSKAPATIAYEVQKMPTILRQVGHLPITQFDRATGHQYREARAHCKASTLNREMRVLRLVLRYAYDKGYLRQELHRQIPLPTERLPPPNYLSADHLTALFSAMDEYTHVRCQLLYLMGLRPVELARMRVTDLDLTHRVLVIPETKGGQMRTARAVPIPTSLVPLCMRLTREYLRSTGSRGQRVHVSWHPRQRPHQYVFCHPDGTPIATRRGLYEGLQRARRTAGIAQRVSPYTLRHQFATTVLRNSKDLRAVQELLGHKRLNTTQRYTHVLLEHLREAVESVPLMIGISSS